MNKKNCILILFFILVIFIIVSIFLKNKNKKETFVSGQCPTTMIKNGENIMIYNPKLAKIPGVNPIILNNLEDYKEYVRWQRKNNLDCPILHLEKVFDVQGSENYEIKSSYDMDIVNPGLNHSMPVIETSANHSKILDASRDSSVFNKHFLPGFDPDNQMVGNGVGSDDIIIYPNSENLPPKDYLRRK